MITSTMNQEFKMFFPRMLISRRNKNQLSYCSTNSINYEKELISQSQVKANKPNFFQLSHITLEEYDKALIDSTELINSFDENLTLIKYNWWVKAMPTLYHKHPKTKTLYNSYLR